MSVAGKYAPSQTQIVVLILSDERVDTGSAPKHSRLTAI